MTTMYDIAIIGAGPAGTTLARLLPKRYKILLVDKTKPSCCGGLLAPDAQKMIARFGYVLPNEVLCGPQLFSVRVIDFDNHLERFYQRHYINVDRQRFDNWLLSLVPPHVHVRQHCSFLTAEKSSNGYELTLKENGNEFKEHAKILVGAEGAFSQVRRTFFPNATHLKSYLAIQEWFHVETHLPYYGAFFDREITDFYGWTISKESSLLVGIALDVSRSSKELFERFKEKLRGKGFTLDHSHRLESAQILRPMKSSAVNSGNDTIFLIGEAAGLISPSSAEGISYAMKSAENLADALQESCEGADLRYHKNLRGLLWNLFFKNLKSPTMYTPCIRKGCLGSGLLALDIR